MNAAQKHRPLVHGVGESGGKEHADDTLLAVPLEPNRGNKGSCISAHGAANDVTGAGTEAGVGRAGVRSRHGCEGGGLNDDDDEFTTRNIKQKMTPPGFPGIQWCRRLRG